MHPHVRISTCFYFSILKFAIVFWVYSSYRCFKTFVKTCHIKCSKLLHWHFLKFPKCHLWKITNHQPIHTYALKNTASVHTYILNLDEMLVNLWHRTRHNGSCFAWRPCHFACLYFTKSNSSPQINPSWYYKLLILIVTFLLSLGGPIK